MAGPFILISQGRIKEGRLDDFNAALREMAKFVEDNEPRVIAFEAYLNDDDTQVTGVQIHRDANSNGLPHAGRLREDHGVRSILDTESVEVYEVPNDAVLGMMKQIGDQFGSKMSVQVRTKPVGGFARAG